MNRKRTVILIAGLALFGVAALAGMAYAFHVGPFERSEPKRDLGPVIATVDGRPIYLSLAKARVEGLTSVHGNIEKTMGKNWHNDVLNSLVEDQLIQEEAERRGIVVTDKELAGHVSRLRTMFQSEQAFEDWLVTQHMDIQELERRIVLQTLAARVYVAVTADVTVSPAEIRAYYRSHRTEWKGADGTIPSLLETRRSIRDTLLKPKQDRAFAAWLENRRQQANIVVLIDDWWRNLT